MNSQVTSRTCIYCKKIYRKRTNRNYCSESCREAINHVSLCVVCKKSPPDQRHRNGCCSFRCYRSTWQGADTQPNCKRCDTKYIPLIPDSGHCDKCETRIPKCYTCREF